MPSITIDGADLLVCLKPLEQLAAFRFGTLRVPLASVTAALAAPDAWKELRGIRAPGTGIPFVIAYGTRRFSGGKDLALVRGGRRPALRVDFAEGAPYARLVASVADPESAAADIRRAAHLDT
ncbi:MAG TPA: hypothetical protein VHX66_12065 [Solirubrobacteraceae bacterium]|jgi:hypothetical protein|nr:hypothetical protein [Solirubrobacteraceae bacterium]